MGLGDHRLGIGAGSAATSADEIARGAMTPIGTVRRLRGWPKVRSSQRAVPAISG
jgi:hypothetical protein